MAALADTLAATEQLQQLSQDKPQRGKRMLSSPSLSLASLRSSFSQMSLQQDRKSAQLAQPALQRSTKTPASLEPKNASLRESKPALPHLHIPIKNQPSAHVNSQSMRAATGTGHDEEDDGYFTAANKYNSDDDPTSPSSASPTSPFSTHDWVDFRSAQPPTPPVNNNNKHLRHIQTPAPKRVTPLRSSSTALGDSPSVENSPMLAASARFHTFLNRGSQDSLSLASVSSGCSSPSSSSAPSPTMRAHTKRPAPVPASSVSPQMPPHPFKDARDTRPDPPANDMPRHLLQTQYHNNSSSHLPLNTLPSVAMEVMRRNRSASVASYASLPTPPSYLGNASTRERSNSIQSPQSHLPKDRYSGLQARSSSAPTFQREDLLHAQQRHQQRQHLLEQMHSPARPLSHQAQRPGQQSHGLTPSEMMFRRFDDQKRTSNEERMFGSKTSIARPKDPRKVVFGDMITIVTVERTETPPLPPSDKKKKKKKMFSMGSRAGPHPDPEYDSDYYNEPYTPEPAEVVITQAPWIGNPNYDEEKQNSSFYYDYDDEEEDGQGAPGYDGEDEEYEDDEDEYRHGNGSSKKKGGIFKFKRAVNRLLRN
ncbi:MAG: hypothetical protein J3Q66DRAFT_334968 [Benniella sp.]|nr:MAG: hypothetical protein J3Q66DRAFT_334968 [Benniella sp.]